MNYAAIDEGVIGRAQGRRARRVGPMRSIPTTGDAEITGRKEVVDFVKKILIPVNAQQGDKLPGFQLSWTRPTARSRRAPPPMRSAALAVDIPEWHPGKLHPVQLLLAASVRTRPSVRSAMTDEEREGVPAGMKLHADDRHARLSVRRHRFCAGLHSAAAPACSVCPGKKGEKALVMKPFDHPA